MWRSLFFSFSFLGCISPCSSSLHIKQIGHTKHCLDVRCRSTVRKFGSPDEIVWSLKFSNLILMKAELKIGVSSQTGKGSCQQADQ